MSILLYAVGTLFGLSSLVILYLSLFGDRSRGRARCSRCWYDMGGLEEQACPECGWTARKPRHLYRTRRRWRLVSASLLAGLIGAANFLAPRVFEHGWLSIVPTTALLYIAPPTTDDIDPQTGELRPVPAELKRRRAHLSMWDWQWRMYIKSSEMFELNRAVPGKSVLIIHKPRWMHEFVSVCAVDDKGNSFGDDAIYYWIPDSDPQAIVGPTPHERQAQQWDYRNSHPRRPVEFRPDLELWGKSPARQCQVDIRVDLWDGWDDPDPLFGHKGMLWRGKIEMLIPDFRQEI